MSETILIVDDSTFIVEGLVALLKKKSYVPIPSYGGDECLRILQTTTPSLIILDILMEPMDGWETLARIKENPSTRHIPVLMFSAKKISPAEAEAHRIIIDDFLTKPVNPKKLLEAIGKILERQRSNRVTIETWTAAGVSQDVIGEYLLLKTSLDVDVSLLAVMNRQLGMSTMGRETRDDLLHAVALLEERIALSRARISAFCQEQRGVLPAPATPETLSLPEDAGAPGGDGIPVEAVDKTEICRQEIPETPSASEAPGALSSDRSGFAPPPGSPGSVVQQPAAPLVLDPPVQDADRIQPPVHEPEPDTDAGSLPLEALLEPEDPADPPSPLLSSTGTIASAPSADAGPSMPHVPEGGTPEQVPPPSVKGERDTQPPAAMAIPQESPRAMPAPSPREAENVSEKIPIATPGYRAPTSPTPGEWRSPGAMGRFRKEDMVQRPEPELSAAPAAPQGFFARIIAAILGLFSRR